MPDMTYDPKKFAPVEEDQDYDPNQFVPVQAGAGADVARRDMTGRSPLREAGDFALDALPATVAAAAVALSGPAAPLTVTALAALAGGYTGKGIAMGIRTATGVGAESVPKTFLGRQGAGLKEGIGQMTYEVGVGLALRSAERVARASIRHAERSELYGALRQEQKLALQQKRATDDFEKALSINDDEIARIDKSIEDLQVAVGQQTAGRRKELESKIDGLTAKKMYLQRQATEEAFRIDKTEAAAKGVDAALAATGAGVPGVGQTASAHADRLKSLVYDLERNKIENMGGAYVGLVGETAKHVPEPVSVRPLFGRTIAEINKIKRLEGTGRNLTEIDDILAGLEKDFAKFGKGKPAKEIQQKADAGTLEGYLGKTKTVTREAKPAKDEQQSLAAVVEMQGNLSQEIAKQQAKGKSGERTARILRMLQEDTDKFIEEKMLEQGWREGPGLLKAVRNQWANDSAYMEQQVFQLLKKDPSRAHELLTADSGYAPVLKKVLKDTGGHDLVWPEIRRRWIESNFVRNGKLDFTAFVEGARREQPIIGLIFDTPQAKAQFQRLHLAAMKMEVLEGKTFKGVASQAKMEALHGELQQIGEEIAAVNASIPREMDEIFNGSKEPFAAYKEKLDRAKGLKRTALKEAYERRVADIATRQTELGLLQKGVGRDILGPVPKILAYRGASGLVTGGLAGMAMGHGPGIEGMIGAGLGLGAGVMLTKADEALVKRMVSLADDPYAMSKLMNVLNSWEKNIGPKAAQSLRLAILGYTGTQRTIDLASSH